MTKRPIEVGKNVYCISDLRSGDIFGPYKVLKIGVKDCLLEEAPDRNYSMPRYLISALDHTFTSIKAARTAGKIGKAVVGDYVAIVHRAEYHCGLIVRETNTQYYILMDESVAENDSYEFTPNEKTGLICVRKNGIVILAQKS